MALTPGTRLGPYEVLAPLGEGGMGTVYRARDTRLDRTVAVKVIHADAAENTEARLRFEREARAVAALNHPHICTLHDVGRDHDTDYLVMELLDGETLCERLMRGPLPLQQALTCATQIADALANAHRHGIIHRDLKPGNIMLTKTGVKLLDFGLAKLRPRSSTPDTPTGPGGETTIAPLTGDHTILGTVQYMAPEQLEGRPVDSRADLFAFGAVVYEMVTGRRAFPGTSPASVIGAILKDEPATLTSVEPLTPPSLARIVGRCLAKDPDERWQSAKDLVEELKHLTISPPSTAALAPAAAARPRRPWLPWAVAAGAVVAAAASLLWPRFVSPEQPLSRGSGPGTRRFLIPLPDGMQHAGHRGIAVLPDGSAIVVSLRDANGGTRLFLRRMDGLEFTPIDGSDGGQDPFISPDGRQVGFSRRSALTRIPILGGAPSPVHDAPHIHGAVWLDGDAIVFSPSSDGSGLWRVGVNGADYEQVVTANTENVAEWPGVIRSTGALVYARRQTDDPWDTAHIVQAPAGEGPERLLIEGGYGPAVTESGHLLFVRDAALHAVALDQSTGSVMGAPAKVVPSMSSASNNGGSSYAISREGTLVYQTGGDAGLSRRLVWVDRQGVESPFVDQRREYARPSISRDGNQVVAYSNGGRAWVGDTRRSTLVAFSSPSRLTPIFTPDGRSLTVNRFHTSGSEFTTEVSVKSLDGSGPQRAITLPGRAYLGDWSPDQAWLLVDRETPGTGTDVVAIGAGTGEMRVVADSRREERSGRFSPDGRFVAYESDESGRPEVYIAPFGRPGEKIQVSTGGGQQPRWARQGHELFYRLEGQVFAVDVTVGTTFSFGRPRQLFKGEYVRAESGWDVTPNGQRFLMIKEDAAPNGPLVVVEHFFDELERLAPHVKR